MKCQICLCVVWIVAGMAVAKPGLHFKTHHKHSKSRDLSREEPYHEEENAIRETEGTADATAKHTVSNRGLQNSAEDAPSDPWIHGSAGDAPSDPWSQGWEPTHEDYGSEEEEDAALLGEKMQDDLHRPTEVNEPTHYDPCKNVFCHYGRVCRAMPDGAAMCECAGEAFCEGHSKRVCGDDGQWYSSHCELHRQACVKRHHIKVDHSATSCATPEPVKLNDGSKLLGFEYEQLFPELKDPEEIPTAASHKDVLDVADDDYKRIENEMPSKQTPLHPTPMRAVASAYEEPENGCTEVDYADLKESLLHYHCSRVGEDDCPSNAQSKQFVVNIMFNYYDRNDDAVVDMSELNDEEERDHLSQLSLFCDVTDIMTHADVDADGNITHHEFFAAFDVSRVHLEESKRVLPHSVTSGDSLELKCDIQGVTDVIWKRNGGSLDKLPNEDIKVFKDGSLYIAHIGLHHLGNYSCKDKFNEDVAQTHIVKVLLTPLVSVSPVTQYHQSGASVSLKCLANGVPEPSVSWLRNDRPLPADPRHYTLLYSNATLNINSASYASDSGAYKCTAKSTAGTTQGIANVFIDSSHSPTYHSHSDERFIVFHQAGLTVYDPSRCYMQHTVSSEFSNFAHLPDATTRPVLCENPKSCAWGSAINVQNKLAYVTQPTQNRIIVVSLDGLFNPIEIINTDDTPVKLAYVEHLDQVWVVCWNGAEETGASTMMVIHGASQREIKHNTQYITADLDTFIMSDLFVPPHNDLENKLMFGYVTRYKQQALYKLDLHKLEFVQMIDLSNYKCVPRSVSYLVLGGKLIVHCSAPDGEVPKSSRLVLDYITDKVLEYIDVAGEPFVSPDGRRLVTLDRASNTLSVFHVNDLGKLDHVFDEYTSFHMSGVTFYPSQRERGFDFFASSADSSDVLYVNLASGKIEIIEGVGEQVTQGNVSPWSSYGREIVTGGKFSKHLTSPSQDSVIVIDGERRQMLCEWRNVQNGNVAVWVEAH